MDQPNYTQAPLAASRHFTVPINRIYILCKTVPGLAIQADGARGTLRWHYLIDMDRLAVLLAEMPPVRRGRRPTPPRHRPPAERSAPGEVVGHAAG